MRDKSLLANIDNSDLVNYPKGRIKNNTGSGNGTPVNEIVYGDLHEMKDKLMRRYGIEYNNLPDNEENGYQSIQALQALPSKNDFLLTLGTSDGKLAVSLKLSKLEANESFILKASIDKTTETTIIGSDSVVKSVTFVGDFKANEYVRMISTPSTIILVRLVDAVNLDTAINELLFLKKATQTEENAGEIDNRATTPQTNKIAFSRRVNGPDSSDFLATTTQNGLLSKEDKLKIDTEQNIVFTNGNSVEVQSSSGGNLQNNFNFNYVDVFPPPGKTMANLKSFMVSTAESWIYGDANDDSWCKYQIQETKIRVICGCTAPQQPFKVNWMAVWI